MNDQNKNVNFFRKYRFIVSIVFALIISAFFTFLAVIFFTGGNSYGSEGIIIIPSLIVVFFVSRSIIFKILAPVTSEEIAHNKLLEEKLNVSNKYTNIISWILLLSVLGVALYICNRYFGFIK